MEATFGRKLPYYPQVLGWLGKITHCTIRIVSRKFTKNAAET